MGEVTLRNVTYGTPDDIWTAFGTMGGCTREEFSGYAGNSDGVYAIELSDATPVRLANRARASLTPDKRRPSPTTIVQ